MSPIRADGADVLVEVKVVPGSSRTRLMGRLGDRLKIAVASPPQKGRANTELTEFLADCCGVRARDVTVEKGTTTPRKTVRIHNVDIDNVHNRLGL